MKIFRWLIFITLIISIPILVYKFFYSKPHPHLTHPPSPKTNQANSILVLVNKDYYLPGDYVPSDLVRPKVKAYRKILLRKEAAKALEALFEDASRHDLHFIGVSAYRSYQYQAEVFGKSISQNGRKHTEKFVARPGSSEHQTGLAIDVAAVGNSDVVMPSFAKTKEAKWLAKNAARFGFIIRYPKGKEHITGYAYEPWHIRYVGIPVAKEIVQRDITLDEYVGKQLVYTHKSSSMHLRHR